MRSYHARRRDVTAREATRDDSNATPVFRRPGAGWPDDVMLVGGDLRPAVVLDAYAGGLFPMHLGGHLAWWFPDPRGILPVDGMYISTSLERARRRFEIRIDTAFDAVIEGCADPARPHGWINNDIIAAYRTLHEMGAAHSVEAWAKDDGMLAGGLYGVSIGGLFAADSKFYRRRDASKVAVAGLVDVLSSAGDGEQRLIDVQWQTEHLARLGVIEVGADEYLRRLEAALTLPDPDWAGSAL